MLEHYFRTDHQTAKSISFLLLYYSTNTRRVFYRRNWKRAIKQNKKWMFVKYKIRPKKYREPVTLIRFNYVIFLSYLHLSLRIQHKLFLLKFARRTKQKNTFSKASLMKLLNSTFINLKTIQESTSKLKLYTNSVGIFSLSICIYKVIKFVFFVRVRRYRRN